MTAKKSTKKIAKSEETSNPTESVFLPQFDNDPPDANILPAIVQKKEIAATAVRAVDSVEVDRYRRVSEAPVSEAARQRLMAPINPMDVEVRPDGIIYYPEIKYRRILNEAFGPMGWAMVPRGEVSMQDGIMSREYALFALGRYVSEARGEMEYQEGNKQMTYPTTLEGVKSNALMRACFDVETEVLTEHGFRLFSDVGDYRILQVEGDQLVPVAAKPFYQAYDGPMILNTHEQLNFCVTPNHEMVTTKGKVPAIYLLGNATNVMPRTMMTSEKEERTDQIRTMELIGYILADGSLAKNQWRIDISREHKVSALQELGLHHSERLKQVAGARAITKGGYEFATKHDQKRFMYPCNLVDEWLDRETKTLRADALLKITANECRAIFNAWAKFDGHRIVKIPDGYRVYCSNPDLLDQMEVIGIRGGFAVSKRSARIQPAISPRVNYSITASRLREIAVWSGGLKVQPNKDGIVWCVTVPSGVIVVRRSGFSMLCGNCKDLGIASELWDPNFIESWLDQYAVQVWREGQQRPQWRRKDRKPFWNEKGVAQDRVAKSEQAGSKAAPVGPSPQSSQKRAYPIGENHRALVLEVENYCKDNPEIEERVGGREALKMEIFKRLTSWSDHPCETIEEFSPKMAEIALQRCRKTLDEQKKKKGEAK